LEEAQELRSMIQLDEAIAVSPQLRVGTRVRKQKMVSY
jgi:hypothetical protein